jgi:glucose-6-phosphate 1-dehydrogenase
LLDVMLGDPTLYTRTDAVESAWRFCSVILDAWNRSDAPPPLPYVAGTWGPDEAEALMSGEARWRRL